MPDSLSEHLNMTRLWQVLDDVRTALKTGDYPVLDSLAWDQEALVDQLIGASAQHIHLPEKDKEQLLRAAERNRRLLESAMRGLKSAARRSSEIAEARQTTKTYDRAGHRSLLEPALAAVEKRR